MSEDRFQLTTNRLRKIIAHFDAGEDLCIDCDAEWSKLTTAERREFRNTYEFEKDN